MIAWNQAAAPMATTTGSAADVGQLAASYQLGTPLQAHRPTLPVGGFCGLTFLTFIGFVFTGTGMIGTLLALFIPSLRGLVGASGIVFFVFSAAFGLVLLYLAALGLRSLSSKAYACTEGFLEVDKDGAVKAAVRWDQMQVLWHRIQVASSGTMSSTGSRTTSLQDTYIVGTANGGEINVEYAQLWKRIEGEFVRLHFPQALAMFNAGQRVPFNAVSVSRQGVSKETLYQPGRTSMIALQNLAHVKIRSMELCFEGVGAFLQLEVVRVPVSETANVCLLEALLKTVSGGRIVRIELGDGDGCLWSNCLLYPGLSSMKRAAEVACKARIMELSLDEKRERSDFDGGNNLVHATCAGSSSGPSFFRGVAPDEEKYQDFQAEYECSHTRTAVSRWGRHLLAVSRSPL